MYTLILYTVSSDCIQPSGLFTVYCAFGIENDIITYETEYMWRKK